MTELKPCPFCGSESVSVQSKVKTKAYNGEGRPIYKKSFSCRCNKCKARGAIITGWVRDFIADTNPQSEHEEYWKAEVIEAWNRREK
jgi:Lar family restriction alleviation protein